ncbi:hypothetical protein Agabi119p4_2270 [Agaricus bisporus var. burnettii]|uniref:CFEM domain-containing protein n=1 Tax=Agaricus bisporus var. burnettii TaxID=192524 RepID=A0A8H7KJT3_AGABI|nr:hypothetical protein Agabi119p4_2270 [Agaricus bisporus var. burnettii]
MFLAVLFALSFALSPVLAQDIATLSPCAVTCIQQISDCALTTPQCLCPDQQAIASCINQTCPPSDVQDSIHAIDSFCQSTSSTSPSPTTQTTSRPATTSSSPSTNIPAPSTSNPGTTSIKPSQSPQQPSTTSTDSSTSLNPTSTTSSASSDSTSSTTSLPTLTPLTTLSIPPSQGSQTVVVFSTQFASPTPITGNTSGATASLNFISTTPLLLFMVVFVSLI